MRSKCNMKLEMHELRNHYPEFCMEKKCHGRFFLCFSDIILFYTIIITGNDIVQFSSVPFVPCIAERLHERNKKKLSMEIGMGNNRSATAYSIESNDRTEPPNDITIIIAFWPDSWLMTMNKYIHRDLANCKQAEESYLETICSSFSM